MPGIFITIMDETNIGHWSSGHVGKGKSMCLRWFRSCRTSERYFRSNRKLEKPSWRSQEVYVVPRRSGTRRRTDWVRVDKLPKIFVTLLREIQNDLETKIIEPEDFKDPIVFMSMFNDFVWKNNDDKCISNAEKRKDHAKRFQPGHWTFLGPGSEKWWYGDSHGREWNCTANKIGQRIKSTGHPIFTCISTLSRGILKQRTAKTSFSEPAQCLRGQSSTWKQDTG